MADDEADLWAQVRRSIASRRAVHSDFTAMISTPQSILTHSIMLRLYILRGLIHTQIYGEEAPPEEKPAVQSVPAALLVEQKQAAFAAVIQPGVSSLLNGRSF